MNYCHMNPAGNKKCCEGLVCIQDLVGSWIEIGSDILEAEIGFCFNMTLIPWHPNAIP